MSVVGAWLVASLALSVAFAIWLGCHPAMVRAAGRRIADLPPVRRLTDEADQHGYLTRVARRLGVEPTVALLLVVGLLAVGGLALLFTHLLDSVLEGDGIAHVDRPASRWLAARQEGGLTAVLLEITRLGTPLALALLAAVVGVVVARAARTWLPLLLELIAAGGIGLLVVGIKALVGRPRPPHPYAVVSETGWSFPSGHAAGTAAIVLFSAWALTYWAVRWWAARVAVWTAALLLVGAVGFSRVYLGVHYISDVLAGWALGALWACVVALAGTWWQNAHRSVRGT